MAHILRKKVRNIFRAPSLGKHVVFHVISHTWLIFSCSKIIETGNIDKVKVEKSFRTLTHGAVENGCLMAQR